MYELTYIYIYELMNELIYMYIHLDINIYIRFKVRYYNISNLTIIIEFPKMYNMKYIL